MRVVAFSGDTFYTFMLLLFIFQIKEEKKGKEKIVVGVCSFAVFANFHSRFQFLLLFSYRIILCMLFLCLLSCRLENGNENTGKYIFTDEWWLIIFISIQVIAFPFAINSMIFFWFIKYFYVQASTLKIIYGRFSKKKICDRF